MPRIDLRLAPLAAAPPGSLRPDLSLDPATTAVIARMTTPPTPQRRALIDALIRALKAAGVWGKTDAFYMLAAHDAQAARLNWIADAYNLTVAAAPAFTPDRGYAGDGAAASLDTGFNPVTASGARLSPNSAHLALWNRTARGVVAQSIQMGAGDIAAAAYLWIETRFTGDQFVGYANQGLPGVMAPNANNVGHYVINRSGATAVQTYKNGAGVGSATTGSKTPPRSTMRLLAVGNQDGTAGFFTTDQLAFASIGASLTASEAAAQYGAARDYLAAVGAA